jgi:polar amino acid transport system substrate-binding protein
MLGNKLKEVNAYLNLSTGLSACLSTIITVLVFISLSPEALSTEKRHEVNLVSFVNPPYMFDNNSNEAGLVNEIIKQLFERAKVSYTLQLMPKKRAIIYTEKTANTCVLPIERNQEREAQFVWISPILVSMTGLFGLPEQAMNQDIITLIDAKESRIGSHLGSASGIYLEGLGFEVDTVALNSANIHKLKAGRIDYWESDKLTAQYISQQSGIGISKSQLDFFTQLYAIACNLSTDSNSVKAIRETLYEMYHEGAIDRIISDYRR